MGGKSPCMVMEASGYGSRAGVLAPICQIHYTPILILSSHVVGLGKMYYFHSETRYLGEPILRGKGNSFCCYVPHRRRSSLDSGSMAICGRMTLETYS